MSFFSTVRRDRAGAAPPSRARVRGDGISVTENLLGGLLALLVVVGALVPSLLRPGTRTGATAEASAAGAPFGLGGAGEGLIGGTGGAGPNIAALLLALALAYLAPALWRADQSEHRLPNRWTHPLALLTLLLGARAAAEGDPSMLLGAAAAAGALGALHLLGGMGMGDVKLAVPLGALLGVQGVEALALAGLLALLSASLGGLARLRREGAQARIAFGPFLLAATGVVTALG